MKNFPHQIAGIEKLTGAFRVIAKLIQKGLDLNDDTVVGSALARAGVYTFRDKTLSITQALAAEKKKPRQGRGSEAAARDLVRLLKLSEQIEAANPPSHYALTALGKATLSSTDASALQDAWREGMLRVQLEKNGHLSHPYHILLRLVKDLPGIEYSKLMLALEANDDSEVEFARIRKLAALSYADLLKKLHISAATAANAVKILPSIARQLGDIETAKNGLSTPAAKPTTTEDGYKIGPPVDLEIITSPKDLTSVTVAEIGAIPKFNPPQTTLADLTVGIEIRKKRIAEHQKAVGSLAALLDMHGYKLFAFPFDCLAFKKGSGTILIEVKTLDGSASDERRQAELAIGQLCSYSFFDVPPEYLKAHKFAKLAAFTEVPSLRTVDFLKSIDARTLCISDSKWVIFDGQALSDFLPDKLLEG